MADEKVTEALRVATDTDDVLVGAAALASVDDVFAKSSGDNAAAVARDGLEQTADADWILADALSAERSGGLIKLTGRGSAHAG